MLGNQLKKPAKAREVILSVIGMLTFFYFSYTNFFVPKQEEVGKLTTTLTELTDKVSSLQKLNTVLREKSTQQATEATIDPTNLADQDPKIQLIQRYKKQKYLNISDFIQDVTTPVFRGAVYIDSVKYDPVQILQGYQATKFNIIVHGDFNRVLAYVKKLENISALLAIDTLSITVGTNALDGVSLILAGTFYQLEDQNG